MDKAIGLGVGPADGLGGQLAVRFAASGHHVFVAGRTQASLDELSSVIEGSGGQATAVVTAATTESSVTSLLETVAAATGAPSAPPPRTQSKRFTASTSVPFAVASPPRLCR